MVSDDLFWPESARPESARPESARPESARPESAAASSHTNFGPMRQREWGLILCLSLLWGCSFPFAKIAVAAYPPLTLVFLRVSLAALMLYGILCWMDLSIAAMLAALGSLLVIGVAQ